MEANEGLEGAGESGGGCRSRDVEVELNVQELAREVVDHSRERRVPLHAVRQLVEVPAAREACATVEGDEGVSLAVDAAPDGRRAHGDFDGEEGRGRGEGGRGGGGRSENGHVAEGVGERRRRSGSLVRRVDDERRVEAGGNGQTRNRWEVESGREVDWRRVDLVTGGEGVGEEAGGGAGARRTAVAKEEGFVTLSELSFALDRVCNELHEVDIVLAEVLEDLQGRRGVSSDLLVRRK